MTTANQAIKILKTGGVGVLPTDTIYGLVGSALSPKVVERIYQIRERDLKKPLIILIGAQSELAKFGIRLTAVQEAILNRVWPGPVSVILPCPGAKFKYLHRGAQTLAFRLPYPKPLQKILLATGPLVAPSANLEGRPPAETVAEAKKYFGQKVNFYLSADRRLAGKPSSLVKIDNSGKIEILRQGRKK